MTARAFWRLSYFAVFFTKYLNFSWYNFMEAIRFLRSVGSLIINLYRVFMVLFHCLATKTIRQSTDGRISFDKGHYGRPIRNDPDVHSIFYDPACYRRIISLLSCAIVSIIGLIRIANIIKFLKKTLI